MRETINKKYLPLMEKYFNPLLKDKDIAKSVFESENIQGNINHFRQLIGVYRHKVYNIASKQLAVKNEYALEEGMFKKLFPPTLLKETTPFIIPDTVRKLGIIGDLHIPFHSEKAIEIALTKLFHERVDGILINGDGMDFYALSRWEKDPDLRSFSEERQIGILFYKGLRQMFPGIPIYWKMGNHEERLQKYVIERAPDLHGIDVLQFHKLFTLDELKIVDIDSKRLIYYGEQTILYGHELPTYGGSPLSPARSLYNKTFAPTIMNHCHKTSNWPVTDIRGRTFYTSSIGCLCDIKPSDSPVNNNNQGFAISNRNDNDTIVLDNFRIDKDVYSITK